MLTDQSQESCRLHSIIAGSDTGMSAIGYKYSWIYWPTNHMTAQREVPMNIEQSIIGCILFCVVKTTKNTH